MGAKDKIIPGIRAHNGTEPELLAEESRFTIRLWKEMRPARSQDRRSNPPDPSLAAVP